MSQRAVPGGHSDSSPFPIKGAQFHQMCYTVQYSTPRRSLCLINTGRPVTNHASVLARQIPDVCYLLCTKRPTLFFLFIFPSCIASCRACIPCFTICLTILHGDLSQNRQMQNNDVLLPSLVGATRFPDIACPCLHLGLPCAVPPVFSLLSGFFYPSPLPLYRSTQ